jgi:hypothetical protein
VRLAARGTRETERGVVAVADPGLVRRLKEKAKRVHVQSLGFAVVVTVLVLLIP